jgi:tetratricopeptide (TPR) repeat protein
MSEKSFWILADCYDIQGRPEASYQTLQELLRLSPDIAGTHFDLGHHLVSWGKFDDALDSFNKAESLRTGYVLADIGRWQVAILREEWTQANSSGARIVGSKEPFEKWRGFLHQAVAQLYQGRIQNALGHIEEATSRSDYQPASEHLGAHSLAAHVLLEKGDLAQALEQAQKDLEERKGHVAEWEGLFYTALAQGMQRHWTDADTTAEELLRKAQSPRTVIGIRLHHHLVGELASLRGDIQQALRKLHEANSLLTERGMPSQWEGVRPRHVPIWFSLAKVNLAAGDEQKAMKWFQRITESTTERLWWPIPYVRSFYFLGKIHEDRGAMEKAREYYQRFVDYWGDGDMDRERVEEARKKIAS